MNVINILRKDWVSYRKTMLWAFFYLFIFLLSFRNTMGVQGSYIVTITMAVYIVLVGSIQNDEKNRVDDLLGILPLRRSTVILGKFLLSNAIWIAGILIYVVCGLINQLFFKQFILIEVPGIWCIAGAFLSTSFLNILAIPLSYKFGSNRGRLLATLITVMIFSGVLAGGVAAGMSEKLFASAVISGILSHHGVVIALMIGLGLLLQAIGYFITLRIYLKKEL